MALLLLEQGAEMNAICNGGNTALHGSAASGQWVLVNLLLERGADIYSQNNKGETALDLSVGSTYREWRHEQVDTLLRAEEARLEEEVRRQAKWNAFVMGQHVRLGKESCVISLPSEITKMVLDMT
jgi:hypothetical protein